MLKTKFITGGMTLLIAGIMAVSCGPSPEGKSGEPAEGSEVTEKEAGTPIASPRKQAAGQVGSVNIVVDYGSPGVKDRPIWGGLVPYDEVWRAGANETTSIEFSKAVKINGKVVPAGKYGFYIIPKEGEPWVAIINTDWSKEKHSAWGAYNYTPEHDVVRIDLEPEWVDENEERLKYAVRDSSITFAWEKARLSIPVEPAEE